MLAERSACLDPTGTSAKLATTPPASSGVPGTATVPLGAATAALKTPLFQAGLAAGTATLSVGVLIAVVC